MTTIDKIKEKIVAKTKENFETGFVKYQKFMKDSTQEEFSKSQKPFYYAVEAFPAILCYLAAGIKTSELRLKVAENIWEEHGKGDPTCFHTSTFKQFLNAIDSSPVDHIEHNPFITKWVSDWYNTNDSFDLSIKLAAIEYLYAPISDCIANHLTTLILNNEQSHYSKHAVLDWEHGEELLDVAISLVGPDYFNEECNVDLLFNLFDDYQKEFLDVYDKMIVMTKAEAERISKLPIAFYYQREDPKVISKLLTSRENNDDNVLMICSGGESLMQVLNDHEGLDLRVFDMNPHQIQLVKNKLSEWQFYTDMLGSENRGKCGKFEALFDLLRERTGVIHCHDLGYPYVNEEVLKYVVNDLFRNDILSIIFTEDAVKYTEKDFSEHFFNVFRSNNKNKGSINPYTLLNMNNIFYDLPFSFPSAEVDLDKNNIEFETIKISSPEFFKDLKFKNGKSYDVVDISNIGDWMPLSSLQETLSTIYEHINKSGSIIARKLLADYDLKKELQNAGFVNIIPFEDHFYEEAYIATKL